MRISIIGGGAFGTSLANALKKEHQILIYTRNQQVIADINQKRKNVSYFPNKILSKKIKATNSIEDVNHSEIIILCIPSHAILDFISQLNLSPATLIVNGAKGFGKDNMLIPDALNRQIQNQIISLKGPSFANELIFELPTAFTIACEKKSNFKIIKSIFRTDLLVFDYSADIQGVELLSILKNIYAIIVGIVDAYYNSSNVRFLVFTKALNEIKSILNILNIPQETLFCYAGIGDFGLTALNDLSRNRTLGLLIGKGFFGKNIGSSVVLEGVKAVENIILNFKASELKDLQYLDNLNNLLKGEIDIKLFVNNVIYK
jgi:glycerol-3-phosphate dehydrogenase (NAD(P)+)